MPTSNGKMDLDRLVEQWASGCLKAMGLTVLKLTPGFAFASSHLPGDFHGDPADRIITATAIANNASLLTVDRKLLTF